MGGDRLTSSKIRRKTGQDSARAGFGVAPILYMLGLIGVGAGVLFSSYSQSIKNNITLTNGVVVKNDLDAASTTMAATSVLSDDGTLLCPPGLSGSPDTSCSIKPPPIDLTPFPASDPHLPGIPSGTNLASYVSSGTATPEGVGYFLPSAGAKQVDPWGHYYVVCRWVNSPTDTSKPAFQIISAGPGGVVNTKCGDATAASGNFTTSMNAANAVNRASVWQVTTPAGTTTVASYGASGVSVDSTGNLDVPHNILVGGTLGVSGAATLSGTLGVNGLAALSGGATVSGGTFTANTSNLGPTTASTLTSTGSFTSTGSATLSSTLAVTGATTMTGDLTVGTNAFSVTAATGNTSIGGTFAAIGTTTLGSSGATTTPSLQTYGTVNIGTTVVGTGTSIPYLSVGKGTGSPLAYPFSVDQGGNVNAGTVTAGSFNGTLNGSVVGGTVSASSITDAGTLAAGNTTITGNLSATGTITASGGFIGTMVLGTGGVTMTGILPIANGGTGANTALGALTNLGGTNASNLTSGTLSYQRLDTTNITSTGGPYNSFYVDAYGRVTSATLVSTSSGITDGVGDSITAGTSLTFTIGSTTQGLWSSTGLMIGSTTPAKDKLDVYGGVAIGTSYAALGTTAPTDGLIVVGSVGIGTNAPVSALQVNGTITATSFSGGVGAGSITGTLGTGNGGTGTNTTFTQGSVVFAGSGGAYAQNNAQFFWDNTNYKLGIGTATPKSMLQTYNGEVQIGSSGVACSATNGGALRYDGGNVYYCDGGSTWQTIYGSGTGGIGSGITLGASAAATNPQRSGEAGTGLYTAGSGLVDVAASGTQIGEFSSTGLNLATGGLSLGGQNGVSYPADFSAKASIAIGSGALAYQTAAGSTQGNVAVGYRALGSSGLTTAALNNTAVGYGALASNTTGSYNTAQGTSALSSNTTGLHNTAQGFASLDSNTTGNENTAQGLFALIHNTTGSNNLGLGYHAGSYLGDLWTPNTTPSQSLFLGALTKAHADGETNQIVIGYNATGLGSNTVVLGNSSITTTALMGNVGIGTTAPVASLDLSQKTDAVALPVGTTGTRPTGGSLANGEIRYNSTIPGVEAYVNGAWTSLLGGSNGVLGVPNGGTGDSTLTAHGVLVGEGVSAVAATSAGTAGQILTSGGASADPLWTTATYPSTTTVNQLLYSSGANTVAGLATGNNGVLITSGGGVPSISSTLPTAVQGNITQLGTITAGVWNGTTVAIANGGTGQTTAAAARASTGLNIDEMTSNGDSAYTILTTDRTVATSAALTAARTWTLPAANGVNAGQQLCVLDKAGGVTASNTLTIARAGADTINGAASTVLNGAYQGVCLVSDGTSKWSAAVASGASVTLPSLVNGDIWVGNGSNVATAVALSQDVTITNAGIATVNKIQNVAVGSPTGTAGSGVVLATSPTIAAPTLTGTTAAANITISGTEALTLGTDYTTTGAQSDVNLGTASAVRYNGAGTATFRGIVAGTNGAVLYLHNASGSTLTLSDASTSTDPTAAHKVITGTGADLKIPTNTSVTLQYDGTSSRWRVTGSSNSANTLAAGSTGQVQFNGGTNMAANANFFWDNTNSRLAIGTSAAPLSTLDVYGGMAVGASYAGVSEAPANGMIVQGNVGIGTTAPSELLSIANGTHSFNFKVTTGDSGFYGSDGYIYFGVNGSLYNGLVVSNGFIETGSHKNHFADSGVSYLTGGNVGIGTTAPATKLEVVGGKLQVSSGVALGFTGTGDLNVYNTTGASLYLYDGTWSAAIRTVPGSSLAFDTNQAERLRITSTGNVGIGTTAPVASLDLSQKTDAVALPVGTTGTRPTGGSLANGEIRYNSTIPGVEAYVNGAWTSLLGGSNGVLGVPNGGTGDSTLTAHGVLVGEGVSAVAATSAGTAGQILTSGGASADPLWTTATYPSTTTVNQLLYSSGANTVAGLATGNNGVLITSGGGVPSISSTLPTAVQGNITQLGTITAGVWNGTTVAIANGGTGQTTAAAARASTGLNIDEMTSNGDSAYTILTTDRTVATSAALTAARTWTLPAANGVNAGQQLCVLDKAGGVTASNTLTIARAGADTINGAASTVLNGAYQGVCLVSDGTSKWSAAVASGASVTLPSLVNGDIWVGNGSNVATAVALSQDVTITNAGIATVNKIQNVAVGSPTGTAGSGVVLATSPTIAAPTLTGTTAAANITISGTEALTLGTDYTTTGAQSDVNLGTASAVRYNGAGTATFRGIVAGTNGAVLYLHNASGSTLTLSDASTSTDPTAAHKVITGTGADLKIPTNTSVTLQYDGTSSRWRVTGSSNSANTLAAGSTGQVQFNGGTNMAANANFFWDNTNSRLAIGTSAAPLSTLDVYGGMAVGASYAGVSEAPANGMIVQGNVGIGTTSPGYKLDVSGLVMLGGSNLDPVGSPSFTNLENTGKMMIGWNRQAGNGEVDLIANRNGGTTGGFNFYDLTNAGTLSSPLVTIQGGGNVGIGTSSPSAMLDVNGDALINGLTVGKGGGNTYYDTAVGMWALGANTSGGWNTAVGYASLTHNASGVMNVAVGMSALNNNLSGVENVAMGYVALNGLTTGAANVAVGYAALLVNNSSDNVAVGMNALYTSTGWANTVVGSQAGTGSGSAVFEYSALFGYRAGLQLSTGSDNTLIGSNSGVYLTTGGGNTFLGESTGFSNSTGTGNVFLGSYAGYNEMGSNKLYIANSNTSSPLVYGDFSSNVLAVNGSLGVGTTTFTQPLTVNGNVDAMGAGYLTEIANAGSTGTTVNKLAKLTSGTAVIAGTSDTDGIVGVVIGGSGTTGNAQIAINGQASCVFENATTAGDFVTIGTTTAGDCRDAGATRSTTSQTIGRVLATGSAGTSQVVSLGLNAVGGGGVTSGVWNGTVIGATYGGTGVNNGANTITLGGAVVTAGAFTTAGAYPLTLTTTGTTNVTLPTSGTLLSTAGVGTITSGVWNGTAIDAAHGGTGATTLTGYVYGNGTGVMTASTSIPESALAALGANQILGSLTAVAPSGLTVPSCSTSASALLWTSGSGFSCNASINAATLGGATFAAPGAIGGGTAAAGTFTTVSATSFSGTGASLTSLNAGNISSGILGVTYGGTGLATLTSNAIYKGNGTGAMAVSGLTDNGTIISSSESIDATTNGFVTEIANAGSTGTTVNKLAKLTSGTAVIAGTSDTDGMVGVVIGGAGTTGSAQIAVSGQASCVFENATTAGHFVTIGTTTAGDCRDAGATRSTTGQTIGRVLTTGSAGTSQTVALDMAPGSTSQWTTTGSNIYYNAGNVGIGTTGPSYTLDVQGSSNSSPIVNVVNNGTATDLPAVQILAPNLTAGQDAYLTFGKAASTNNAFTMGFEYVGSGSSSNYIGFNLYGQSAALAITGAGNVGIGTTSPQAPLHVSGSTAILGTGEGGTPSSFTLRGANGSGSNTAGGTLNIQAGNGTGYGGSGSINFLVAGASSVANTTFDNGTATTASAVNTTVTVPFTVGSNSNRLLIVDITANAISSISSVTYNGVAMTQLLSNSVAANSHQVYYLVAPATGTHNLVITGGLSITASIGISSFYNVSQTTPVGAVSSNSGVMPTTDNLTVSSAAMNLVYDSTGESSSCPSAGGGQTAAHSCVTVSSAYLAATYKTGAASVTMAETISSGFYDHVAFSIKSISDGGLNVLTTAATITNTGSVGIGTTGPTAILSVNATTSYGTDTTYAIHANDGVNVAKRLVLGYDDTLNAGVIASAYTGNAWQNTVINPVGGNVAIGTTAATQSLTVNGNVDAASGKGYLTEITNAGSTGTTVNKLAKLSSGQAVIAATTDMDGIVGIVVGGAGTTGNAQIAVGGQASCVFENATTVGDFVTIGTTTAGDCHDAGTSRVGAFGQTIGRVLSAGSAGTTQTVAIGLNGPLGNIQTGFSQTVTLGGSCSGTAIGTLAKDASGDLLVCDTATSTINTGSCSSFNPGAMTFDRTGGIYLCTN